MQIVRKKQKTKKTPKYFSYLINLKIYKYISVDYIYKKYKNTDIPWNSGCPAFFGASSSQSLSVWLRKAMLRNCLPPLTFQVPMQTRICLGLVYLWWFWHIPNNTLGDAAEGKGFELKYNSTVSLVSLCIYGRLHSG